jgi:riboflavin synthase
MFTGLIEETGRVVSMEKLAGGWRLVVEAPGIGGEIRDGDSISVNGCCLTAVGRSGVQVGFDLLEETLARTNLGLLAPGSVVNLERALAANGRLGGHFVQGHVDCTSEVVSVGQSGADDRLELALPEAFSQYIVFKGSIAVDGISLTVAELLDRSFVLCIIPHTKTHTKLGSVRTGDLMNLEFDILAKYVERVLKNKS